MHAINIKQPYAERIAAGHKRTECRSWRAPSMVGSDLLIVSSKTVMAGYRGEPKGVAVCVVRVTKMTGEKGDYEWHVSEPRRVVPFAVRGWQGLYKVPDASIRYAKPCAGDRAPATDQGRALHFFDR